MSNWDREGFKEAEQRDLLRTVKDRQDSLAQFLVDRKTGDVESTILAWAEAEGIAERKSKEYFKKKEAIGLVVVYKNDGKWHWKLAKEESNFERKKRFERIHGLKQNPNDDLSNWRARIKAIGNEEASGNPDER